MTHGRLVAGVLRSCSRIGYRPHALCVRLLHRIPARYAPKTGRRQAVLDGVRWQLDLSDNLQRTLYFTGRYEPRSVDAMRQAARCGDTVVDIGANIGVYALPLAIRLRDLGGGRIIAVEPSSRTRAELEANLASNELDGFVTIAPVAFSDTAGEAALRSTLAFGSGDAGTASLLGDGEELERVVLVRGRSWLVEHGVDGIDLLKVDVEGAEVAVPRGLDLARAEHPPRLAHIEVVCENLRDPLAERSEIFGTMASVGLRGSWVNARGLKDAAPGDRRSGNVLFRRGP